MVARKPLRVVINSAGRSPHATLRQLILHALLKLKKRGGCTKHDIKLNIERYYNCKLGKRFMGQLGRSLVRLVKEAQIHNHYERYQIVPSCVVKYDGLGVRQKRPHCFCMNPRCRLKSRSRSRSRSRSKSRSRSRSRGRRRSRGRSRRPRRKSTGLRGFHGRGGRRRRRRRGRKARKKRRSRGRRRGPSRAASARGRSRSRHKKAKKQAQPTGEQKEAPAADASKST